MGDRSHFERHFNAFGYCICHCEDCGPIYCHCDDCPCNETDSTPFDAHAARGPRLSAPDAVPSTEDSLNFDDAAKFLGMERKAFENAVYNGRAPRPDHYRHIGNRSFPRWSIPYLAHWMENNR